MRGATDLFQRYGNPSQISIHAPRAGRDDLRSATLSVTYEFQSTRPVRGATVDQIGKQLNQ